MEDNELPFFEKLLMGWLLVGILLTLFIWPFDVWFNINMGSISLIFIVAPLVLECVVSQARLEIDMHKKKNNA